MGPRVRCSGSMLKIYADYNLSFVAATYDFAKAKNDWYPTWPEDKTRRGMAMYE